MLDIFNTINFDPLIIVKLFVLIFIALVSVIAIIFVYQIRSLNKVVTIIASFSSGLLQTSAFVYLLVLISLFIISLVIL